MPARCVLESQAVVGARPSYGGAQELSATSLFSPSRHLSINGSPMHRRLNCSVIGTCSTALTSPWSHPGRPAPGCRRHSQCPSRRLSRSMENGGMDGGVRLRQSETRYGGACLVGVMLPRSEKRVEQGIDVGAAARAQWLKQLCGSVARAVWRRGCLSGGAPPWGDSSTTAFQHHLCVPAVHRDARDEFHSKSPQPHAAATKCCCPL